MNRYILLLSLLLLSACGSYKINYQEEYKAAIASGQPLVISFVDVAYFNSVDDVGVNVGAINLSSKPIKYLNYKVVPYNAVGDVQRGSIRRLSTARLRDNGPYASLSGIPGVWENVWDSNTIRCVVVTRVEITYMDGTKTTYGNPSSVQNIMRLGLSNSCAI